MGAVSLVAGSYLQRNRRSSALISLLLALAVAVVLAALAGARRTDAAIGDFVAADKGADGYAFFALEVFGGTASRDLEAEEEILREVDGIVRTARASDVVVQMSGLTVQGYVGMEPGALSMMSRLRLVAGKAVDETRPEEVLIDEELARDADLAVGSRVDLRAYTSDQLFADASAAPEGVDVDARVVGIVRRPTDLRDPQERQLQPNDYVVHQDVYLTPAFWDLAGGDLKGFNPFVAFEVDDRTDLPQLLLQLTEESGAYSVDHHRFLELSGTFKGVDRSASLQSRALQVFAGVVAMAGLFLVGQTLGRQIAAEAADSATLRALGLTPRQLLWVALLRAAPVALLGSVLGVLGAVALSPLAPLPGTVARRAELDPGLSVDTAVLLGGGLLASFLVILAGALPAARAIATSLRDRPPRGRRTTASRLSGRGLPPPALIGIRFALEPGRGRTAVPVRTASITAAAAVALVVGAATFSASLTDTRETPLRYGVTWDVAAGAMSDPEEAAALAEEVHQIPGVEAFSAMGTTAFDTPFGEIPSVMLRQEKGRVTPLITSGSAPGPGEVALGALTMTEEDLDIGDELLIDDPIAGTQAFRITGSVVLNVAGLDVSIPPGRGALFDWSMLAQMDPQATEFIAPAMFLVDAEPGRTAEVEERLHELFPTSTRSEPVQPLDLVNLGDASLLPAALGAVVAVLGLGTVAHAMLSAVRRRQRELAVLKTMGFVRAQTRWAVIWQSLTFGTVALVVGLPLGVAAGRTAWSMAAGELGIPSHPVVTVGILVITAGALVVALILTAVGPAQLASRVPAADVLRQD